MLYAWGAWLIFFAREKNSEYIEDPTPKGTTMNFIMNYTGYIVLRYTNWCLDKYLKVQDKFFPAK